ncbi:DNA polymerase III subunit beta [Streptomyces sp. TUS-ST3]|uniref:DNA polymerase III subunit beta n=1 Tax=Streptomyces sp. TUS-ST3 TaxID=3025591 RepID=UPI0024E08382|nr:DNA polymerase III subunit beta [Streptomyces sp. TUS-ST3]GLP64242.1 DNA polymerase III subunit beta [Streptomyces sp. TUS-ST3]
MKLRIDQKQLAEAARRGHRRLPNNPLQPLLGGLLLETDGDSVTISGFDYETSTRAALAADVLEPGHVLVSGRLLADVTAAMPAGPIDLVVDGNEATLTAPGTTFTLPTMDRRDYPALPEAPASAGTVDGDLFAAAVVHAAQASMPDKEAAGKLEGLRGVHVAADGDHLTISATDRYRIVRHRLPWTPDGNTEGDLLVPAAHLAATVKQLSGGPVRVSFTSDITVAALANDTLTVTSRTIATPFPDIDRLFLDPAAASGWMRADAGELLDAVKRVALVNDKDDQTVALSFDSDQVTVQAGIHGPQAASSVGAESVDLDGFTAGYRAEWLTSVLAPIDGQVQIWFTTPNKPVLLAPIDDDGSVTDTYRAVCMPVRLK